VAVYNDSCSGLCAFGPFSYIAGLGIGLVVMGIALPVLGNRCRQHPRRFDLIQDCIFGIGFIVVGGILFIHGWRFTLLWQFAQWILVESVIYWVIKDISR